MRRVRYVHVKSTPGRASTTEMPKAEAIHMMQRVGGCVHRVVYGSSGVVKKVQKIACSGAMNEYRRRRRRRR